MFNTKRQISSFAIVVLTVAFVGAILLLLRSFAATGVISVQGGDIALVNASITQDSSAFGGDAIEFGSQQSSEEFVNGHINPLPGVTVGCPGCAYDENEVNSSNQKLPAVTAINDMVALTANKGQQFGVTIDTAWLQANQAEPWVYQEGGKWVVDGVKADGLCVNILAKDMVLRNSFVNCPTTVQDNSWGYPGTIDDGPAIGINTTGVTIEYSTVTCSGYDSEICSRSVWASKDAILRRNDFSFSRGGVQVATSNRVEENYFHHYSYGVDLKQDTGNNNPGITHNNGVNLQGYIDAVVARNYIDARYGRASLNPNAKNAYYKGYYGGDGTVSIGQNINGFGVAFYALNGSGAGSVVESNYISGGQRSVACNPQNYVASCGDFRGNIIEQDSWINGNAPSFHMIETGKSPQSTIFGNCNRFVQAGVLGEYLGSGDVDAPHKLTSNNCSEYFDT